MFDYDQDEENRKLKRLAKTVVFFLVVSIFTLRDLNYYFLGESAEATVTNVRESSGGEKLTIEFEYIEEDGNRMLGRDEVHFSMVEGFEETVPVEYFSGDEKSAEIARPRYRSLLLLLLGFAVLGYSLWPIFKDAREYAKGTRPRRNRR
ncbi:MAG: hypothetical protein H8E37_02855 [Planctomycetes bacterium]|nr:hypothetical protein [Planctomycetota bacterium]